MRTVKWTKNKMQRRHKSASYVFIKLQFTARPTKTTTKITPREWRILNEQKDSHTNTFLQFTMTLKSQAGEEYHVNKKFRRPNLR